MNLLDEKARARLAHVDADLNGYAFRTERISLLNKRIENGESNARDCIISLESYALAKSISSWFNTQNLNEVKNWFYVRSKLDYIANSVNYGVSGKTNAFENKALHGLFFLISDHSELIQWYSNKDEDFIEDRINNTKLYDYWTAQFFYALRRDWGNLIERCENIIANPPTSSREKKFFLDQKFYLALARGDIDGMVGVIKELVSPKRISTRSNIEDGYTENLICTPAIIYSKLAWQNDYQIIVDSPYIPKEWLPIQPLEKYTDPFEFMKKYVI